MIKVHFFWFESQEWNFTIDHSSLSWVTKFVFWVLTLRLSHQTFLDWFAHDFHIDFFYTCFYLLLNLFKLFIFIFFKNCIKKSILIIFIIFIIVFIYFIHLVCIVKIHSTSICSTYFATWRIWSTKCHTWFSWWSIWCFGRCKSTKFWISWFLNINRWTKSTELSIWALLTIVFKQIWILLNSTAIAI